MMNGFIGSTVAYVTGDRIVPMCPHVPLLSIHVTDTAFAFSCRNMLCSAANVGTPLIRIRSWCSK